MATNPYEKLPEPMQNYLAQVTAANDRLVRSQLDPSAWGHAAMDACQAEWTAMEDALPAHLRGLLRLHFKPLVLAKLQVRIMDAAFELHGLLQAIQLANNATSVGLTLDPSRAPSPHIH